MAEQRLPACTTGTIASVLFPESGGPAGSERYANRLILYRENRMIGKANLDWQMDRYNRLKLGGEFTHYKIDSYASSLESQAFSDLQEEADPVQPVRRRSSGPGRRGRRRRPAVRLLRHPGPPLGQFPPDLDQSVVLDPTRMRSSRHLDCSSPR